MNVQIQKAKVRPKITAINVTSTKITVQLDMSELTYELPEGREFAGKDTEAIRHIVWDTLLFASKPWMIAQLLNDAFGVQGMLDVRFRPTPTLGVEAVELR